MIMFDTRSTEIDQGTHRVRNRRGAALERAGQQSRVTRMSVLLNVSLWPCGLAPIVTP